MIMAYIQLHPQIRQAALHVRYTWCVEGHRQGNRLCRLAGSKQPVHIHRQKGQLYNEIHGNLVIFPIVELYNIFYTNNMCIYLDTSNGSLSCDSPVHLPLEKSNISDNNPLHNHFLMCISFEAFG